MKSKYIISAFALFLSLGVFAQKDQLKALEKAIKNYEPNNLKKALSDAEAVIGSAADAEKAQYYFLKGNAHLEFATKGMEKGKNLVFAAKSYQDLLAIEKTLGKKKYSSDAETSLVTVRNELVNAAIEDNAAKKYKEGTEKLYEAYKLNTKDTVYLYYAANGAVNAKEYDKALSLYDELKKLNYSGKGMAYYAKNVLTEEEDFFNSKQERDNSVKMKLHANPRDEKLPSKRGEILRNYALILVEKGESDKARTAIQEARKSNPEDHSLAITEANLYLEAQDFDSYKKIVNEILTRNPNDVDLYYNLGVISSKANNAADAEKYYLKAIEIDPKYKNAYLNLAIMVLDADTKLVDESNKLGNSAKDNKRYEEIKVEREKVFKKALPYLEKVVELDPKNKDAKQTLMNVYSALDMTEKYKAIKSSLEE
jgi:tetratricopeptide (TPR) repeat protein